MIPTGPLTAGVGLNWVLFDGFRVNITKAKLDNLEALFEGRLGVVIEGTIEDMIMGYYLVLLQQERLKVLQTVMRLSEDRYSYELEENRWVDRLLIMCCRPRMSISPTKPTI